jgi:hypothetical protein
MAAFDGVIVGAGQNGLTLGAYLGANHAPGYNAANVIAQDLELARFRTPIPLAEWHG